MWEDRRRSRYPCLRQIKEEVFMLIPIETAVRGCLGASPYSLGEKKKRSPCCVLKAGEKGLYMPPSSLPVLADNLWQSLACGRIALISASVTTCAPVCLFCGYVLISSSYQDTNHSTFRVHPNPARPVLT